MNTIGTRFAGIERVTTATMVALLALGGMPGGLSAQSCPLGDDVLGYPVVASSSDSLDPSFLAAMADAAAFRWRVPTGPSSAAGSPVGRMAVRLRTPVPLWDEQWKPGKKHRATMTVVMDRHGAVARSQALLASGDERFDRSLESILDDPTPGATPFPRLPDSFAGDSAVITLSFGDEPAARGAGVGVTRFAAQQRRPNGTAAKHMWPWTWTEDDIPGQSVTVKFDLTYAGKVDLGSIQVLEASDPGLASRTERYVSGLEFLPGEANCRPIAQTMIVRYRNKK